MSQYDKLVNIIVNYVDKDEIEDNEEVMSVTTLDNLLKEKYHIIDKIKEDEEIIKNKINEELIREKNIFELIQIRKHLCRNVSVEANKDSVRMVFAFGEKDEFKKRTYKAVVKKIGEYPCYCDGDYERLDDKLYNSAEEDILSVFDKMESFHSLLYAEGNSLHPGFKKNIPDDNFQVTYYLNEYGAGIKPLSFKKEIDPNHIQYKQWYGRISINDFIKSNEKTILNRIPVKVKDLPIVLQDSYSEYLNDKEKVKVYEKKS